MVWYKYLSSVCSVTMLALLVGCSEDFSTKGEFDSEIYFTVLDEGSRGDIDQSSALTSFSVWGRTDTGDHVFDNAKAELSGKVWTVSPSAHWNVGKTYKFYAATGYKASSPEFKDEQGRRVFTVSVSDGETDLDLMTAKSLSLSYQAGKKPESVDLKFKHEKAQITLSIRADAKVPLATITNIKLTDFYKGGVFTHYFEKLSSDPYDGTWNFASSSKSSLEITEEYALPAGEKYVPISELLIPSQGMSGVKIMIAYSIGGIPNTETFDLSKCSGGGNWMEAGTRYNLSFVIRPNGISFDGIVEEPWKESHSGGDINIGGGKS